MKVRVFRNKDNSVIYSFPAEKYQCVDGFVGCIFPEITNGLEYVDMEESELPSEDGRDWFSHGPLYFQGDTKKGNIFFDEEWSVFLMRCDVIKRKHIDRLNKQIDDEHLAKSPDILKISKLVREREKCHEWDEKAWYQKAIQNLDARVAGGEPDKPSIRQKLIKKIAELNLKEK